MQELQKVHLTYETILPAANKSVTNTNYCNINFTKIKFQYLIKNLNLTYKCRLTKRYV